MITWTYALDPGLYVGEGSLADAPKAIQNYNGVVWYVLEMYLGICISCLIPLSPVLLRFFLIISKSDQDDDSSSVEKSDAVVRVSDQGGRNKGWMDTSILDFSQVTSGSMNNTRS